jgi:hypothetical protein
MTTGIVRDNKAKSRFELDVEGGVAFAISPTRQIEARERCGPFVVALPSEPISA